MMGKHEAQKGLFSYCVNLDARVRQDHPLREVAEKIDFSFVREEVAGTYGSQGNVSVDPEVILKLMFLLFWDDVRSERELMRVLAERLDYLWFIGYGLDDGIPDHSVLSKARARWGAEVFESIFLRSVSQCVEEGLVSKELLHMDGSLIEANASKDAVRKGTCDGCGLRPLCTKAKLGRTVQRRRGQELIDEGIAASSTKEAKRSIDRRKWLMKSKSFSSAIFDRSLSEYEAI